MKIFNFSDKEKLQSGIDKLSNVPGLIRISEKTPDAAKRKINKKRLAIFLGAAACFLAGLIYTVYLLFAAKPLKEEIVFELGEPVPAEACAYLDAGPIAGLLIKPDLSEVTETRPGEYNVLMSYMGRDLSTVITIKDTIPPEFIYKDAPLYFPADADIMPTDLIFAVKDADKSVTVNFDGNLIEESRIRFTAPGSHSVWIVAKDSSGNTSRTIVDFIVDTLPRISVHENFYIAAGSEVSLTDYVRATDDTDGDLSGRVTVFPEDCDFSGEGEFEVFFSVTDSCGFTDKRSVTVHVMDPEDIQRLIGRGIISRENATIIGAINVYDIGLISNENFEDTLIDLMPTVVHIEVPESAGTYKIGSGYITEITEDAIYILTNRHVVAQEDECDVYFYTTDCVKGSVIGTADDYDVAVIKVKLSDLPPHFENIISTVHIDLTYWENLSDNHTVHLGLEKLARDGTIDHYTYGLLIDKEGDFQYFEPHTQTQISIRLRPGDSGSAVFDARGRLICMAFGYSISPERDWGVPLDEIVEAYEDITGRDLYTY